jgi:hypothetical protein
MSDLRTAHQIRQDFAECRRRFVELAEQEHRLVAEQINRLVNAHGSLRRAAAVLGMDHVFLHRLRKGTKSASDHTLRKLGLVKAAQPRGNLK